MLLVKYINKNNLTYLKRVQEVATTVVAKCADALVAPKELLV